MKTLRDFLEPKETVKISFDKEGYKMENEKEKKDWESI